MNKIFIAIALSLLILNINANTACTGAGNTFAAG